jgi:uncharacterized protein involved in outer membrane biogenesis
MKKWIIRIGVAVVVLVIVMVCVAFFSLNSIVKKGVELVGSRVTKTEVKLGAARISVFTGSGQLSDFSIGNPEGFSTNHTAYKVGGIKLALKPSSLMSDVIQVDEINIQQPEITVEGGINGSNLGKIMDNLKSGAPTGPSPDNKPEGGEKEKNIYIKDLTVTGGKIDVTLTALGGKGLSLPLPPVHLRDIGSPDKGVTMEEASRQVLRQILEQAINASAQAVGDLGKGLKNAGSTAVDQAGKAAEGVKNLFK